MSHVRVLVAQGRGQEVPPGPQRRMEAAHIIPFALNDFNGAAVSGADVVSYIILFSFSMRN